jgi:hypothetical protein
VLLGPRESQPTTSHSVTVTALSVRCQLHGATRAISVPDCKMPIQQYYCALSAQGAQVLSGQPPSHSTPLSDSVSCMAPRGPLWSHTTRCNLNNIAQGAQVLSGPSEPSPQHAT